MEAHIQESPISRDIHHKVDSFYNDMDSGYQSFDIKDSSSIIVSATHSTPLRKNSLPDQSSGFNITKGCLLQETIEEVSCTNTPKKRKSTASTSNSLPKKIKYQRSRAKSIPSSKRKLIAEEKTTFARITLEGRNYIDFLSELNAGYSKVLREIFRLLSPEDLHNMTQVSHKWSEIISDNTQWDLKNNLKKFRHELSDSKENICNNEKAKDLEKPKEEDFVFVPKKPFQRHNTRVKPLKRAHTIGEFFSSPSKRAAPSNEWLLSTSHESTMSCPHCGKLSRISSYKSKAVKTPSFTNSISRYLSYNSTFLTSQFQYDSPESSPTSQTEDETDIPLVKFGECSACKFKFCIKCLCDFHDETPCILDKQVSPSKEEIENGILQIIYSPSSSYSNGRKSSSPKRKSSISEMKKKAKKSLKRLCF